MKSAPVRCRAKQRQPPFSRLSCRACCRITEIFTAEAALGQSREAQIGAARKGARLHRLDLERDSGATPPLVVDRPLIRPRPSSEADCFAHPQRSTGPCDGARPATQALLGCDLLGAVVVQALEGVPKRATIDDFL